MKVSAFLTSLLIFGALHANAATECKGEDYSGQEIIVSIGRVVNIDVISPGVNLSNYVETIDKKIKGNVVTMSLMGDWEITLKVNLKTGAGVLEDWYGDPIALKCKSVR